MKNITLTLALLLSINVFAQLPSDVTPRTGSVSGKVIDKNSKEALPYVTVVIKNYNKETITGGITDDKGFFNITKIPEGDNTIEIQFMGYKTETLKIPISRGNSRIDLGTIALTEEATSLDEVEIIAETSTVVQKIDRKVIKIGKDLTSAGATASELLNNVQSVSVDSQTGNISLRGNENVRVLVDGKPTNISTDQLLKQIPSTSIKSVELITNPSAKYNPEGMSGIINIVLHKNANLGFNGSVNTGVTIGDNIRFNGSLNMNYRVNKVNFFANYSSNLGKRENHGYIERFDNNNIQEIDILSDNTSHLLKTGFDWYITDRSTFSAFTTQNWFTSNDEIITKNSYTNPTDDLHQVLLGDSNNTNATYNANFNTKFNEDGHELDFEVNYSSNSPENEQFYKELNDRTNPAFNYINDYFDNRDNTTINIDYTNPISKSFKMELGAEYRAQNTSNDFKTDQEIEMIKVPNSNFEYNRDIYSIYASFNKKWDKLNAQVGARMEQYEIEGTFGQQGAANENYSDEIFSVYPSAFLTYNPSEKNQYQFSYSRRVDRPGINQVNPILEWSTAAVDSKGNPNLNPQFTNSLELNYTRKLKNGSLTFGTFYRQINDVINRSVDPHPSDPNKVLLSWRNVDDSDAFGIEISSNYKLTNWWRANASFDLYNRTEKGFVNNEDLEIDNTIYNLRISNNFKASKKLSFNLFTMYRSANKSIQFDVDPMWMVNAGAVYNILKGKGSLSFRYNDIFKGMKFQFESDKPYPQAGKFNWESQTAYIGFNYRFGGGKNKARSRKNRDNNEVNGGGFI